MIEGMASIGKPGGNNVGQASRLPGAEGATPFGRFAARAGETPALPCRRAGLASKRDGTRPPQLAQNKESLRVCSAIRCTGMSTKKPTRPQIPIAPCPEGTHENSPAFQRCVRRSYGIRPEGTAEGSRPGATCDTVFSRPFGTYAFRAILPRAEARGYCRLSLRDTAKRLVI